MRALTAPDIIELWETAYRFHPIDQALSMLQQAMPECQRDELAAMPLGQRDAHLLALRQATFGDALPGKIRCTQCHEEVEFELSCAALADDATKPQHKCVSRDGYSVTVRPLNSIDLAAAAMAHSLDHARELLLHRCVVEAQFQNQNIDIETLPLAIAEGITETALAADPQAEKLVDFYCPACHHPLQSQLDIGHILWHEISARAHRLLMEIHQLAKAYGWTETEILRLSPARRAAYLQMVAA
jgi:hypothetical protein